MVNSAVGYLDECGDAGWKLDKPYQAGGSSQYFVVSLVVGMNTSYRKFDRIISKLHKLNHWQSRHEKKWATMSEKGRVDCLNLIAGAIAANPEIVLYTAVMQKSRLPPNLHNSAQSGQAGSLPRKSLSHLLYATMMASMVEQFLMDRDIDSFSYCPDELNENTRILDSIIEYQIILKNRHKTILKRMNFSKPMKPGLTCADIVAGAVWEARENNNPYYFNIISEHIKVIEIF